MTSFNKDACESMKKAINCVPCVEDGCVSKENGYLPSKKCLSSSFAPYPDILLNEATNVAQKEGTPSEGYSTTNQAKNDRSPQKTPVDDLSLSESGSMLRNDSCEKPGIVRELPSTSAQGVIIEGVPSCSEGEQEGDSGEEELEKEKSGEDKVDAKTKPGNKYINFAEKADIRKILAQNELKSEVSESSEMRNKRNHTNYRKSSVRNEITRHFFSIDWYAEYLAKYAIGTL